MLNLLAYQRFVPGLEQVDDLSATLVAEHGESRCEFSLDRFLSRCPDYWKLCDMGQRPQAHIKHHHYCNYG